MSSEVDTRLDDVAAGTRPTDDGADPYVSPKVGEYDEYETEMADDAAYDEYRSLSIAAVAALIFGLLSVILSPVIIVAGMLLVVPAMGVLLGLFAIWTTTTRPDEFTGKRLAQIGLGLSFMMFVGSAALNYQLNKIEVPPEYAGNEVYFWELQSEENIDMNYVMQRRNQRFELPLPEKAKELDGKKIFVTGYVYPGDQKNGLDKFILVPDKGTCCFGGQPKLTDMIEVKLAEPLRVDYSMWRRGVGGTLRVHRAIQAREKLTGVIYQLEADYLSEGPGVTGSADGS